jgi:hypothetical protein
LLDHLRSNAANNPPSEYGQALVNNNISKQTAHRYQALAAVPDEVMEAVMPANPAVWLKVWLKINV